VSSTGKRSRLRGWRWPKLAIALSLLSLSLACPGGGDDEGETGAEGRWVDLVEAELWTPSATEDDPFADHRPDPVVCNESFGWRVEESVLGPVVDIDTFDCNYLSLVQPSLEAIPIDASLEIDLYHFDLTAAEVAEAHLAMTLEGVVIWEKKITVPGAGGFAPGTSYVERFELPAALADGVAAGQPVNLHVHNHGQNTYVFVSLRALLPDEG